MNEILSLFHHIHHLGRKHEVHHCGGKHCKIDPGVNYTIRHCKCGKHSIDKKIAIGHVVNGNLNKKEVKIKFTEKCHYGGWHIEGGRKI